MTARAKTLPIDILLVANFLATVFMAVRFYYPRFLALRNTGNPAEFLFYALVIFAATLALWRPARQLNLGWRSLAPLQVLLVLHMLGGVTSAGGVRLYDRLLFGGVTFDKFVHAVGGLVAAQLLATLWPRAATSDFRFAILVRLLAALGLGAAWELVEYAAYALVPLSGVGSYDNNMQDLLANLIGALVFSALPRRWQELQSVDPGRKALERSCVTHESSCSS